MISWTKLLTGKSQESDNLRYSGSHSFIPKIVVWNTTSNCNLRCQHCYFEANPIQTQGVNELSNEEAKDFIDDLARLGVSVLLFSGGEPLLRKDIFELAQFAKDRGIKAILSSNGTLINQEVAKKIKQAGFSYIGISLDGTEETNDAFRQSNGAFIASLAGIHNCQALGLKVGLRFTLTKYNLKDLPAIFDLVESESVPRLCIYHLVYAGRGRNLKDKDLGLKEKRQALELIWRRTLNLGQKDLNTEVLTVDNHSDGAWIYLRLKKSDPRRAPIALKLLKAQGGNSSGIRIAAVDNCGNIYPDQFWKSCLLGNIRQKKFSHTWQDKGNRLLRALENRSSLFEGRCSRCNFLSICNGNFRARAEAVFGDPWADDPACYLTEREIHGGQFAASSCLGTNPQLPSSMSTLPGG